MSSSAHVTDHAVLRYLERVQGLDLAAVRRDIREIVRPGLRLAATMGLPQDFGLKSGGVVYMIEGGHVVTVLPGDRAFRRMARLDLDGGRS